MTEKEIKLFDISYVANDRNLHTLRIPTPPLLPSDWSWVQVKKGPEEQETIDIVSLYSAIDSKIDETEESEKETIMMPKKMNINAMDRRFTPLIPLEKTQSVTSIALSDFEKEGFSPKLLPRPIEELLLKFKESRDVELQMEDLALPDIDMNYGQCNISETTVLESDTHLTGESKFDEQLDMPKRTNDFKYTRKEDGESQFEDIFSYCLIQLNDKSKVLLTWLGLETSEKYFLINLVK